MPTLSDTKVPAYRLHRGSGQAVIWLNGEDKYLGKYKSAASRANYNRVVAEWLAGGRQLPTDPATVTIAEIAAAFRRHARIYYRHPDGSLSSEVQNFDYALAPLLKLYGKTSAVAFGPHALLAVRHEMIRVGWVRNSVNKNICRVKQVFKWAVAQEMIDPSVFHGLTAVSGLRLGRSEAAESDPVKAVAPEHARAIRPHVSAEVAALIDLQLLTGMRPGEAVIMRGRDLEMISDDLWLYHPASHKTQHLGHERCVYLGPKAIEITRPFLRSNTEEYLLSPAAAMQSRWASGGSLVGARARRNPAKYPGDRYTTLSYYRAIREGCDKAFAPPDHLARQRVPASGRKAKSKRWETAAEWRQRLGEDKWAALMKWRAEHCFHPHQLRHTAATELRKTHGLEAAQVLLGHKTLTVTQVYAEKNVEAAMKIVKAVG